MNREADGRFEERVSKLRGEFTHRRNYVIIKYDGAEKAFNVKLWYFEKMYHAMYYDKSETDIAMELIE